MWVKITTSLSQWYRASPHSVNGDTIQQCLLWPARSNSSLTSFTCCLLITAQLLWSPVYWVKPVNQRCTSHSGWCWGHQWLLFFLPSYSTFNDLTHTTHVYKPVLWLYLVQLCCYHGAKNLFRPTDTEKPPGLLGENSSRSGSTVWVRHSLMNKW